MATFALNFSRPGGEIIAQYYNFLRLGRNGYTPHPPGPVPIPQQCWHAS